MPHTEDLAGDLLPALFGSDYAGQKTIRFSDLDFYNPAMKAHHLLSLTHTSQGTAVRAFDVPFLKQLHGLLSSVTDISTDNCIVAIRSHLQQKTSISDIVCDRLLYVDAQLFRPFALISSARLMELTPSELPHWIPSTSAAYGVYVGNTLVSHASLLQFPEQAISCILANIFTESAHRRQGFAKACVSACTQKALVQNRIVTTETGTTNLASFKTFLTLGYSQYAIRVDIFGTPR